MLATQNVIKLEYMLLFGLKTCYLLKQSFCYSMNSLFFQPKLQLLLRQNVFILKVSIFINNQLLSTANANDINTDYYFTNSFLASSYHGSVA